MKAFWQSLVIFSALASSFSTAQMSTLPAAEAIAELPGPPKNPPIFSEMTVILQDGVPFEGTTVMKGPVAGVERIDQPQTQNQGDRHRVTTLKFDDHGRLTKRIYQDTLGAIETDNVFHDGKLQSQVVDHRPSNHVNWQEWQQWSYDEQGRLSDFRAGRDKVEWNHYSNFRYDTDGRPLGYEYRDSKLGGPTVLTKISYSGKTVTLDRLDSNGLKFFQQVQVVDDQNRVVDLRVSDLSGGELKLWYHVAFKYDAKGRVIEQNTDPFTLGDGDDYSPIPGKLIVQYDDEKYSGEQKFFDLNGKLVLHTFFAFDHDGEFTSIHVIDASGKERMGSETFLDPQSHKLTSHAGSVEWEVTYDNHGNWTERRRWFTPADKSPRILTRLIREIITYR